MQLDERAGVRAPWLRDAWYAAEWSANVPAGKLLARTILNEPLVFFRKPDGRIAAMADYCPHRFSPLSIGTLLPNGRLQCAYHGLEYDGSGACVHNPHGNGKIPPGAHVPTYTVVEKHQMAWIWLGDATPDESKIADYSMFDHVAPLYTSKQDYLLIDAPHGLVQDNLMDLSHISYLHEGILGNAEMVTNVEPTLEQRGDQVEIMRSSPDVPVPGLLGLLYNHDGDTRADKWNSIRWDPPGSFLVYSGVTDRGAPRIDGTGYHGWHVITPQTETTTHYHFWAARWNVRETEEARSRDIQARISAGRRFAFEEQDAPVIEAQARTRARLGPSVKPALLSVDAAAVRARRVYDARLDAEAGK